MLNENYFLEIIKSVFDDLFEIGTINTKIVVDQSTVILGNSSLLDSIGFVTFITSLEEKINDKVNDDYQIMLNEIHEFNIGNPFLDVKTLINYLLKSVENEKL